MIGLNQYLYQMKNQTLFDLLELPELIDKETVVDNILLQGGEFEVLYADPDFMRNAIGIWGKKHYYTFDKWATAQQLEYNPIENYDRIENWTDEGNRGEKSQARRDSGNTRTFDNEDKRTLDTNITTENTVSAYDSETYQPADKSESDNTGTDTMNYSGTIKDEFGEGSSGQTTENKKDKHDGHVHGNIGIRSSQELLQQEYDIARFNIVEQITDLFIMEFCIPVYD